MKHDPLILSCALSLLISALPLQIVSGADTDQGWQDLGTDFSHWDVVVQDVGIVDPAQQELFEIQDGIIHVYPTQLDGSTQPFGGLITKANYEAFVLRLEYRWGVTKFVPRHHMVRDAGILFHVHGDPVIWPNSLECQIQEGDTGDIWIIGSQASSTVQPVIRNFSENGELQIRGGPEQPRFARFHRAYCWELPDWNTVEVTVRGAQAEFRVNGQLVNRLFDAKRELDGQWVPLTEGKILLQAEGAEVFYRNIQIKRLDP